MRPTGVVELSDVGLPGPLVVTVVFVLSAEGNTYTMYMLAYPSHYKVVLLSCETVHVVVSIYTQTLEFKLAEW